MICKKLDFQPAQSPGPVPPNIRLAKELGLQVTLSFMHQSFQNRPCLVQNQRDQKPLRSQPVQQA